MLRFKKTISFPLLNMKDLLKRFAGKRFFFLSLGVVGYFCLLYLNAYVIKSDFVLIEFFQEILTLPLICVQFVLFIFSIIYCIRDRFRIKTYSFWMFFILLVNNSFVIGSFVMAIIHAIQK